MRCAFSLVTIIALTSTLASASLAQKRRQRPVIPAITIEKIRRDIVGMTVPTASSDGSNQTSWTFAADELKEIEIKERETKGFVTFVVIHMRTGDRTARLEGDLQLAYRRDRGVLKLDSVDNLSFRVTDQGSADTGGYNAPVYPSAPTALRQTGPQRVSIAASSFAVPPSYYHSFPIHIPNGVTGGRVLGRFRATSGDNIKAHIMDSDALENFRHGNQFLTYYSSGKVTVGNINVRLRSGQYFLVFENFYSTFSNKVVRADVMLEF